MEPSLASWRRAWGSHSGPCDHDCPSSFATNAAANFRLALEQLHPCVRVDLIACSSSQSYPFVVLPVCRRVPIRSYEIWRTIQESSVRSHRK